MKTELEVARDAVRQAGLEELADALEWAAAAVRHRATLLSAARWAATDSEAPCPDCGDYNLHARECPTANMLHALDSEWSRGQVEAAHADAQQWAPRRLWPMPALPRPAFPPLPADIPDGAAIFTSTIRSPTGEPVPRVSMADGAAWELRPVGPSTDGGLTRLMDWVQVASPQPAQPQPEDEPADE